MAITAKQALVVSKKYTDDTVEGGGALKGKNCTIKSIVDITGGHRVTFEWTLDNGTVQTDTMDVMDGEEGPGLPEGGTVKQVIQKKSGTDFDTEWINLADHDDIVVKQNKNLTSPVTIKGTSQTTVEGSIGGLNSGLDDWTASVTQNNGKATFDNLNPNYGYKLCYDDEGATGELDIPVRKGITKSSGTTTGTIKLVYTVDGTDGVSKYKLRILK